MSDGHWANALAALESADTAFENTLGYIQAALMEGRAGQSAVNAALYNTESLLIGAVAAALADLDECLAGMGKVQDATKDIISKMQQAAQGS